MSTEKEWFAQEPEPMPFAARFLNYAALAMGVIGFGIFCIVILKLA